MEMIKKLSRLAVVGMFVTVGISSTSGASTPTEDLNSQELRLVETSPGVEKWLSVEALDQLSLKAHQEGRCGGYIDVTDFPKSEFKFRSLMGFDDLKITKQSLVEPMLKKASSGDLIAIITKLSSYTNRYYSSETGLAAAEWIRDQYLAIAKDRPDVTVELFKHSFLQPSVIATIPGTGPKKNEIVVLGGHLDSINIQTLFPKTASAPGADDNASGTATVMEAFRIFIQSGVKPNRTIQFMGYAGEEKGLLGSADIAKSYQSKGAIVAAALQLDMTMYPGKDTPAIVFMTDYVDPSLTRFTQRLVETYTKIQWKTDKCGYACSDHASWNRAGYPAVMPFESTFGGDNPKIHTPGDDLTLLTADHGVHFLKLALGFITEIGLAE